MPPLAVVLLLLSAILHTSWNLLLKQTNEKFISTWWAVLVGSALFLPALLFTGFPARQTWILLLASVCIEVIYYGLLSRAYTDSEFSLIYPLARGSAPAFIVLWSIIFLGEELSPGGWVGLIIIILGLFIVGSNGVLSTQTKPHLAGILLAITIAFLISIYTVIDGAAVKQTSAFPYAIVVFFLAPVLTSPLVIHTYGRRRLIEVWNQNKRRIIAIGLLTVCAYLLALAAYTMAPVSYAGTIREVSVVLGALAGWKLLGEKMGWQRMMGSVIIFIGVLIVASAG